METIPTAEDIKGRRSVRFTRGHLADHTDWTGTVAGYNALYDTVHVYVDAPGNSESGSKITYSRKDVEWCEPATAEGIDDKTVTFRETTIRVGGVERLVRTEIGGKVRTVKQLEAAHTKAVRAAIDAARQANLDERYADMVADAQKPREDTEGFPGSGERARQCAIAAAEAWRAKYGTVKPVKPVASNWDAARRPLRPLRTEDPTTYLVEVEPGHWATKDAADMLRSEPAPNPVEDEPLSANAAEFLATLLGNVAA